MSRAVLSFTVVGEPAPQGSKTIGNAGARTFVREDNPATAPWRSTVAASAREAMLDAGTDGQLLVGPLRLDVTFAFARPRSHFGTGRNAGKLKPSAPLYCDKRPDLDKLVRAIGDALTGTVVVDDAVFVELVARKHFGSPAAYVAIEALT